MMLAALLLTAVTADLQRVGEPLEVWAPAEVAGSWRSFEGLPAGPQENGGIEVGVAESAPAAASRVDIFRRDGARWVWTATHGAPRFTVAVSDESRGILVRFRGTSLFLWSEIPAGSRTPVTLMAYRNIVVTGAADGDVTMLFLSRGDRPQSFPAGETVLRFVPAGRGIICSLGAVDSRCAVIDSADTSIDFGGAARGDVRVLHAVPQDKDAFLVLTRGNVVIRPREVPSTVIQVEEWTAITLPPAFGWDAVVVDRTGDVLAMQRTDGAALPSLPAFADLLAARERGVVVRPWIGERKRPLTDASAMLVVFPDRESGVSSQIPLTTAAPADDGSFHLSSLGSGTYAFKLLSNLSAADRVKAVVTAGVPADVTFPGGPTVTGRIIRTAGGDSRDPVLVEAAAQTTLQEATQGDLLDKVRFVNADANGDFAIVLASPGRYSLRAQWGAASAEREFEITPKTRELALGEIPLTVGATLRGSVGDCANGEALLIPVPDVSKALTIRLNDTRRAAIDAHGHFLVDGIRAGPWSVLLKCNGVAIQAAPEIFSIPDQGDAIIEFQRQAPIGTP